MVMPNNAKKLIQGIFSVIILTFITQAVGIGIAAALNALPTESSAIANQPDSLPDFIFDIVINTWIVTALGEEFLFRGFILKRLCTVLPGKYFLLASLLQAIWWRRPRLPGNLRDVDNRSYWICIGPVLYT